MVWSIPPYNGNHAPFDAPLHPVVDPVDMPLIHQIGTHVYGRVDTANGGNYPQGDLLGDGVMSQGPEIHRVVDHGARAGDDGAGQPQFPVDGGDHGRRAGGDQHHRHPPPLQLTDRPAGRFRDGPVRSQECAVDIGGHQTIAHR